MARPSKYNPGVVKIICDALANGETRKRACELAGISEDTFANWIADNSDFSAAVKQADARFDEWRLNELKSDAEKSLKKLIQGGVYRTTKTVIKEDKQGNPHIVQKIIEEKEVPPNATAMIFALCNRDPENWKNRVENEIKGKIDTGEKPLDLSKVPTELLKEVALHILDE